jgi:hypothetical protein
MLAWLLLVAGVLIVHRRMTPLPPPPPTPGPAVEFWQLAETRGEAFPSTEAFRFDGQTVTLFLWSRHPFSGRPPDDCYRLQARWQGNELDILHPGGTWGAFMTFEHGRFIDRRDSWGAVFVYKKVRPTDLDKLARPLLDDRPVWDYSTPLSGW